jgi:hypothetical protein
MRTIRHIFRGFSSQSGAEYSLLTAGIIVALIFVLIQAFLR